MVNKYYLISFDKDLGNRPFYYTGKCKNPHPTYSYGNLTYTLVLGQAKSYKKLSNAEKIAKRICVALGMKKQVLIHEWTPQMFDMTRVVKTI